MSKKAPLSNAERIAKLRARGLTITVTLLDPVAIKQLKKLKGQLGGYRRAIEVLAKASSGGST